MLASRKSGPLYIGVTSDLKGRMEKHKQEFYDGFTKKYLVKKLVWYECGGSSQGAIVREKQMKKWKREWKIKLIEESNPDWNDLADTL
jgi:putative endonuclease